MTNYNVRQNIINVMGRIQKQTFLEISKTDKVHWFSGAVKKTSPYLNSSVFLKLLHA